MKNQSSLKKLLIKDDAHSLHIEFNSETNVLDMKGYSLPANSPSFFVPIVEWIKTYLINKPTKTIMNISFEYLHSSAGKQIFQIIQLLRDSQSKGNKVTVNWRYEEEDEDMMQLGMDFSSVLGIPFNFIMLPE